MTLAELMKAVDELSREEFDSFYDYVERRREVLAEERIRMIEKAVAEIREGLTQEELDEMIAAMNAEYVEVADETEWQS